MAKKTTKGASTPATEQERNHHYWIRWLAVWGNLVDRVGPAGGIFALLLFAIWEMGDKKTHNDFIRELLFAEITKTHYVQVFVAVLILIIALNLDTLVTGRKTEKREMKRIAGEKSKLQERLLGRELAHTGDRQSDDDQDAAKTGKVEV